VREAEGAEAAGDQLTLPAAEVPRSHGRRLRRRIFLFSGFVIVSLLLVNLPPIGLAIGIVGEAAGLPLGVPYCHFESSDGRFEDVEIPEKGRDLAMIERLFADHKKETGQPDLILYRTTPRMWWQLWAWGEYAFQPRWSYPYREPVARHAADR
jgi:hypothetical protein